MSHPSTPNPPTPIPTPSSSSTSPLLPFLSSPSCVSTISAVRLLRLLRLLLSFPPPYSASSISPRLDLPLRVCTLLLLCRNGSPVPAPTIAASPAGFASALHNWSVLRSNTPPPSQDLREYLAAFYHGLPVKSLDKPLRWVPWAKGDFETKKKAGKVPEYVGLATPSGACTGVRCRENDFERDGLGHVQLNLSDILDALIEMVPDDAHSVMMIVNHDLYEDEDDDFCAGRAFGGSRVAVVSTFRYNPGIDASRDEVDYDHIWPATHCIEYLKAIYLQESGQKQKKSPGPLFADNIESVDSPGAMPAAVRAAAASSASSLDANGLWLARVCKTASHELGHCFALDHCVYYSCIMQSTAGLEEDDRQPPYLCPVCLTKLTSAVLRTKPGTDKAAENEYPALQLGFGFGFRAWLRRIGQKLEERNRTGLAAQEVLKDLGLRTSGTKLEEILTVVGADLGVHRVIGEEASV
ncbi:hypothetical protein jhhlp_000308 [Lomentospora prolificans]|uniref:Uncharacterized protein n=1 Tax=Lomentospora prolificans TaxID=41688 RepID=A0A2N3NKJ4_9PEZI|nr:hypothetical protein jhhlp_000308 [Lomentospora prolificans]